MRKPKVSISVAVYNVEKYLRKCLDSLVNQTLQDIEIIVVNDGSTDSSESICKEYAERDSRIILISKENGGLATARQAALEVANGQFFCACDADDWVELSMYEKLLKKAAQTNADIVMCDYWSEYPNGFQVAHSYNYEADKEKDLLDLALRDIFPHMIWNKLIRLDVFRKYGISWNAGINMGEDFLMTIKLLQYPLSIQKLNACLYHYRRVIGGTSYTNQITLSSLNQSFEIRKWVDNNIDTQKYSVGVFHIWISLAFTSLRVVGGINADYRDAIFKRIKISRFFLYRQLDKKSIIVLLTKVMGYSFGRYLCTKLYNRYYK